MKKKGQNEELSLSKRQRAESCHLVKKKKNQETAFSILKSKKQEHKPCQALVTE